MSAQWLPGHRSVLPAETLELLDPKPGERWIDCTAGLGGHTRLIAERIGSTGSVLALDRDAGMLAIAAERCSGLPVTTSHANFDDVAAAMERQGWSGVDGMLADLGFCSNQMDDPARGFSFKQDGPLDMRLDPAGDVTAADIVNGWDESDLADAIFQFGEERLSRRIAKRIVERRQRKRFETTGELADAVRSCVPRSGSIDPATRTFQALRIAVNDELGALDRLLETLPNVVKPGGRVGIIAFHSLEDRRVKQAFRERDIWVAITKKPVIAGEAEVAANPRARSAKLRVARRN